MYLSNAAASTSNVRIISINVLKMASKGAVMA
jgi:hypothetical protein